MKHFLFSAFLLGLGLGLIFSYFFILSNTQPSNPENDIFKIPDAVVIERAKELGLIDPTEGISKGSIKTDNDD